MVIYKYCPKCKYPLETSEEYFLCKSCGQKIYKNPKPCVSVLPIRGNKVLLARRAIEPYRGEYDLIGGFMKVGETVEEAAKREVKEETGLDIRLTEILGTYPDQYGLNGDYTINIQYLAKIVGGKMMAKDDIDFLEWIRIDNLPKRLRGFKNTRESLRDLKKVVQKKI